MNVEKGKGVFFHPPISVIDTEEPNMEKPQSLKTRKVRLTYKPRDSTIEIVVTTDGFVAPIMEGSDEQILEFINILIATAMTKGQRALFASEFDLCSFSFDRTAQTLSISSSQVFSLRNRFEFERDSNDTYELWRQTPRDKVSMREIPGAWFDTAYTFYKDSELKNYVLLLGESWGLSYEGKYKAAFLYSWMIIETTLENYWLNHINSLSLSASEKDVFRDNTSKTIYKIIEILKKLSMIDNSTYESLEKLRNIRNKIVHDMTSQISSNDAHNCIHVTNEIIYNKLNKLPSPFVNIKFVK